VLATRATTTHGARVLVVVVAVVAAAAADHVRAFQRLYDRRVPVTRALNLHTAALLELNYWGDHVGKVNGPYSTKQRRRGAHLPV